jgi:hypothetical protein
MHDPSTAAWTLFALIQKPLGCLIDLCALVLSTRQALVPLDLAVNAEALAAFGHVVAAHWLPVQGIFVLRDDDGMAAGARHNIPHGFGEMELQKLVLVTLDRSRSLSS